jgi:hypothetical protein
MSWHKQSPLERVAGDAGQTGGPDGKSCRNSAEQVKSLISLEVPRDDEQTNIWP